MAPPSRTSPSEAGSILIEVMVAMAVLVAGVLGTLGILDAARTTASTAQRTSAADAFAQREIEAMRALSYSALYDCSAPANSASVSDPRHWVTGSGTLLVQQDFRGTSGQLLSGVPAAGEPLQLGTCSPSAGVNPGPSAFTSGNVSGQVYRFVTAEGVPCDSSLLGTSGSLSTIVTAPGVGVDTNVGTTGLASTLTASLGGLSTTVSSRVSLTCSAGSTEAKRLTIAVAVGNAQTGGAGPHRPIYMSTLVPNPTSLLSLSF
jgi:Tfp pilus assembly protein PilV